MCCIKGIVSELLPLQIVKNSQKY